MKNQPHLTDAQYRMLGRAVRGEQLPTRRFMPTTGTNASLVRKGLVKAHHSIVATTRGREVYALHGKQPDTAYA